MRLAIVAAEYPAISETFVADHAEGMADRGHEVTVLAALPSRPPAHLNHRSESGRPRVVYRATARMPRAEQVEHYGSLLQLAAKTPSLAVRLARRSRAGAVSLSTLASYVEGLTLVGDVDVVHCHFGPVGLAVADALDVLGVSTPLVTTFHGSDVTRYLQQHPSSIYGSLFGRGAMFLPVSEYFRRRLLQVGAPPDRTVVHYLGVDTERFRPIGSVESRDAPMRILMVGRFVEKKGFLYGLKAIAQAQTDGCKIRTTLIGDGPMRAELEAEIERLGIRDSTRLRGYLGHDDVTDEMAASDVLLAPSIEAADGDMEGIPIVILEAMAMGLPVVSSRHSGIPEVVLDGQTGLLAPERDSNALSRHLVRLGSHPKERTGFGAAGRALVIRQHSATDRARELESVYARVLDGVAASAPIGK